MIVVKPSENPQMVVYETVKQRRKKSLNCPTSCKPGCNRGDNYFQTHMHPNHSSARTVTETRAPVVDDILTRKPKSSTKFFAAFGGTRRS
jgi:hypothetical protein